MRKKLHWKKILTREYTFLYASYGVDCFKIMKRTVGTTLDFDFFYGEGKILTIYRIEKDILNSYRLIEKIARRSEAEILRKMDNFEELTRRVYALFATIKKTRDKQQIKKFLIELDKTFLITLSHYLFFVFLGYAGDRPSIARFLKKNLERFGKIRTSTIDTDMNIEYPNLFGKYDKKLRASASYMTRSELMGALRGKALPLDKIKNRKKRYLVVMKNRRAKECDLDRIDDVLAKELGQPKKVAQNFVKGQIACRGKVRGPAVVVFSRDDYVKIKKGDILITPMTKPNIVPFLPKVRGIVTNDGGALSHASIISREMKIPCVVGTIYATDVFRDGDLVEIDTEKGEARKQG
ncbi:MAG: Phosphoenolpyruvate synthase/pyruvate phosphate dikinase [Candidatus Magasanikbacteria bacterium GW2011_GWA2_56_11]|uniref:Phosphoenolpyruvate synthase/pyruvate phosphate dikinase n=1 Tax=Candidatus Magasanikbacteria bacterium GW2011_GWA2_56_11 TaxID=1619044 RepID=A0A0G2ANY8_9BACT|nr:MAG: Phosphoenolpyruvate synthase/pyruvate phosphate dikinase [Candidatus Magasanikbacteria bacterium GW2011_GWA2_56_11]